MSSHVAIVGGSLTGNKGASSMVLAVVDRVRRDDPEARITVLSPLAHDDGPAARSLGVELEPFGPSDIVLAAPLALLARLTGGRLPRRGPAPSLRDADVVADVSGIAFVDGRGLVTLVYNVLLVLPALLLGRPVVKIAQAVGPFDERPNRLAARVVLSRMAGLLARGRRTEEHLRELGVAFDGVAADVAFLMEVGDEEQDWAREVAGDDPFVAVVPSQVVLDQAEPLGLDYVANVVAVVDALAEHRDVVLLAHSARPGHGASRLNDIPICEEALRRVARPDRCRLAPVDATPRQLRALIGRSDLLVASRFHAMISGLATGVPSLVVGWSHKYREVLADFDVPELALDFRAARPDAVAAQAVEALERRDEIAATIAAALPEVLASAERNLEVLREAERLHGASRLPPATERRAP